MVRPTKSIRSYSELTSLSTFEERYRYLRLRGSVGVSTFGFDRYFNQSFYTSTQWKNVRNGVIIRDSGCDLGILDREIFDKILIHHMNPMTMEDLERGTDIVLDPEYLISTTHNTHNAIHYGDVDRLLILPVERTRGDTSPWRS